MKLKMPNNRFNGVLYGVTFKDGVSDDIKDPNLCERLVSRGYEEVVEEKPKKKKSK